MLWNSSGLCAGWTKNPRSDSAGGCTGSLHSAVLGGGLRYFLPAVVFSVQFGSAVEPGRQKHLLQTLSLCFRQAHALQAGAANQRSNFLHPTAWWNFLLWDARGMWRLGHIPGELVCSELAVRCSDLAVNEGHPALQSWKLMDIMEEDCSLLPPCQSWLQLETGYSAMWILINLFVDLLLPLYIQPILQTVWDSDKLKALAGLHSLMSLCPKPFEGSHWLWWDLVRISSTWDPLK